MSRPSYDVFASAYDFAFWGLRLGPRVQRLTLAVLDLQPGEAVLDLGCGTGLLLPALAEAVGPPGRVVGVELSARMLELARRRVGAARSSANIELVHADVRSFHSEPVFDAAVFCLVLSTIPDPRDALRSALACVRPGGRVVIADSWLSPEHTSLANLYIGLKAGAVRSDPRAGVAELALAELERVVIRHYFGGTYSIVSGVVPRAAM